MHWLFDNPHLLWLAALWLAYFALHSLLASLTVKGWVARRRPEWMRAYRLTFNGVAVLTLIPPLALTFLWRGESLWRWDGPWRFVSWGLQGLALLGFVWSLRHYDTAEFLGTRQWRAHSHSVADQESLHLSPLHRWVRHPWYALGLVLIWTRDMDPALLLTATLATLYFLLGSRLEERKLLSYHGPAYAEYRRLVPALVPVPWRHLSRAKAAALEARAARDRAALGDG